MIEFNEERHEYKVNGKVLPSVSKICDLILGSSYDGVPKHVLDQAAEFGTTVHLAIELYNNTGIKRDDLTLLQTHCLDQYLKISKDIKPIQSEVIGHYEGYYAGTFDLIGEENGEIFIYDYKTTYALDKERVALQLSLYRLMFGWDKVKGIKAIWLPKKRNGKVVELESWDKEELINEVVRVCTKEPSH